MTRAHAARRLLEHGPLNLAQFREITGWPAKECRNALRWLRAAGEVEYRGTNQRGIYSRAEA